MDSVVAEHFGPDVAAHIQSLEDAWGRRAPMAVHHAPQRQLSQFDVDVLQVGGGPAVLHALGLRRGGLRVAVADRRRVGCAHREWNISGPELRPLVDSGVVDEATLQRLVVNRYRAGFVQWHGGPRRMVHNVLDHAVDATALMEHLRATAQAWGVTLLDGHAWVDLTVCHNGVVAGFNHGGARVEVVARLLLDATGSGTPFGEFDLVCPTVGAVLSGLEEGDAPDQVDPGIGEILVSLDDARDGVQHIWEGFPGAQGTFTAYLFHYAEPQQLPQRPLSTLFERFFEQLPRYKRGHALPLRPTYGFIPSHTRLRPAVVSPANHVVLVGDAAGRLNPLTFCGFGSLVRSFRGTVRGVEEALDNGRTSQAQLQALWKDPQQLGLMGALALMMVDRGAWRTDPHGVNRLLDAAFAQLESDGPEVFGRFLRDEATVGAVLAFMLRTSRRHPAIFREVLATLTPAEMGTWAWRALQGATG